MDEYILIIIGFGISGISLAKEASKNNINYKILEKNTSFGGVWFNTNKYTSLQTHRNYYEFSEEECMNELYGDYPNKENILEYLDKIIDKYDIAKNVNYNYEVKNIRFDKKEKIWIIDNKYKSKFLGICSGINANPILDIKYNELKYFIGDISHYNDLKTINPDNFINNNILLIGNGASACDILKILDGVNCNITCLYRSHKYYISKYIFKVSTSIILNRLVLIIFKYLPLKIYRVVILMVNYLLFYNYLDIPNEKMNSKNLVACNIITTKINNGILVYLKDKIIECQNKNIVLKDNTLLNIDSVILATGYHEQFDFLNKNKNKNLSKEKYLQIFDTELDQCAFIGFSPSYNWPKISEKQSKIFIDYILGNFEINKKNVSDYIKNHNRNQKINNLDFNDLTYELYNY